MAATRLFDLPVVFQQLTDPRDPRGVRFPYHAICSLVFLGLLARICEMAVLVRWAEAHWEQLREPLGFKRPEAPSATYISRSLAKLSLAEFRHAFGCQYLFRVKDNQPDTVEALDYCFDDARIGAAKAETVDKKGALKRYVVFGTI